jgi:hypothetical protein
MRTATARGIKSRVLLLRIYAVNEGGSNSAKSTPFAGDMVLFDVSSAGRVLGRNYPLSLSTEERSRRTWDERCGIAMLDPATGPDRSEKLSYRGRIRCIICHSKQGRQEAGTCSGEDAHPFEEVPHTTPVIHFWP